MDDNDPEQHLVAYASRRAILYREFGAMLKYHLGPGWEIEHVGSTTRARVLGGPGPTRLVLP